MFNADLKTKLSIVWNVGKNAFFFIDKQEVKLNTNCFIFLIEFHQITKLEFEKLNIVQFNRDFHCVENHDQDIGCKGLLFFGSQNVPKIVIPKEIVKKFKLLWEVFNMEMEENDEYKLEMFRSLFIFEPGRYACVCCNAPLFDGENKFESRTGWPSFTQPIKKNALAYHKDRGHGMYRMEAVCNTCDAHLGHVFQDGPPPSNLRYCMNAVSLTKVETNERKATLGGGCFWCTEALFKMVNGVLKVESGYSGGKVKNPTYREVTSGLTGHAEVIQITYDNQLISFEEIVKIHLTTHDPTTIDSQGADKGSQYRSIVFYRNEEEKQQSSRAIEEVQPSLDDMIVTEIQQFEAFYEAELYHQEYYKNNPDKAYCQVVINPKLEKFKALYKGKVKREE